MILEPAPIANPGPRIVFVNRSLLKFTNNRKEEVLGHSLSLLFDPERLDGFLSRLPLVSEEGRLFHTDANIRSADGTLKTCRWTVRAVNDNYGRTLNYIVTIQPAVLQNELQPPNLQLNETSGSAKTELLPSDPEELIEKCRLESLALVAGGMAHDFNNLLQTMIGRFDLMRPEISRGTKMAQHFAEIEEATRSARSLTTHLLAFARGGDRERKLTDICELICKAKTLACIGSSLDCQIEFDGDVRPARVDDTEITQVISNLIINGRQAMNNTGILRVRAENVTLHPSSRIDAQPGDYIKISVVDRGCGIPKENLKNIFDPFFTTKANGTGLGLAVTRAIVRAHNGDIIVTSQINVGTTFEVYLPASEWSTEDAEDIALAETDAAMPVGPPSLDQSISGSVLVIDDQKTVRSVACALIENIDGFNSTPAASGEEGIRKYREALHSQKPFTAVLLDKNLPGGMSGEETMQELRRLDPEARIIASSGDPECPAVGYSGALPKPYTFEEMKATLIQIVSQ